MLSDQQRPLAAWDCSTASGYQPFQSRRRWAVALSHGVAGERRFMISLSGDEPELAQRGRGRRERARKKEMRSEPYTWDFAAHG